MDIDLSKYRGPCQCGRTHDLLTKLILVEPGAVKKLPEVLSSLGLEGRGCVVCDDNTLPYARTALEQLPDVHQTVVLGPVGFHADEKAVESLRGQLEGNVQWLLAVGSGTIHDVTRYVACEKELPFLSFPTAASVDGFVATVCAMTWYGFKKTIPAVAPVAVIADSDIFTRAPYRLTASGIGDVLGKYTSLFDWKVTEMIAGYGHCERISQITREAADRVLESMEDIARGEAESCESLMFALLLSGLAMQMWGDSHPASGAEHHLSHLWEMAVINPPVDAYHGEKVGVGLLLALREYRRLAAIPQEQLQIVDYVGIPQDYIRDTFGELCDAVVEENTPDPSLDVDRSALLSHMDRIREMIAALPSAREMEAIMKAAGCLTTMEELGLNPALEQKSIDTAPFARGRLTFLRAGKLLRY